MGTAGANRFYNVDNAAPGGGALFNWINQIGNPHLEAEIADTYTAGFVINPPFKGALLSGINLTLDYYKIGIDNAILQTSVDNANFNCVGKVLVTTAAEAAGPGGEPGVLAESERPGERRAAVHDHLV